jgi:hypothetical protein
MVVVPTYFPLEWVFLTEEIKIARKSLCKQVSSVADLKRMP